MTTAQRVALQPRELCRPPVSPANRGRHEVRRLLLVETDPAAQAVLARELRARDFDVLAVDGRLALPGVATQLHGRPDAVVLAVEDSHAVRAGRPPVRGEPFEAPVMYLIPRHQIGGELPGFRIGIDDYLVRPFAYAELAVRLRLMIRGRSQGGVAPDRLWLDPVNRVVAYRFASVHLSPTEYRLMARLLARPHTAVTRQQLGHAVWPERAKVTDNLIDQCVSKLRRKLREIAAPHLIGAVRGVGYELMPLPPRRPPDPHRFTE